MKLWDAIKRPFSKSPLALPESKATLDGYGQKEQSLLTHILSTGTAPRRGTQELLIAYKELPWLRSVVDRIAVSTASVQWRLMVEETGKQRANNEHVNKDPTLTEVKHNPFAALMGKPNPVMTGRVLRQTAQIYLELIGESFIIIERNKQGLPVELWPIPPTWVQNTPSTGNPIFRISYSSLQMEVDEKDMLWLRHPDPVNPYGRGTGIGETLGDELDTDEYTAKHVKSWFYNRATPELLVGVKGASENQLRGAKQQWEDSHRGAFRAFTSHWHSGDLEVEQLSQTFADQQLIELRRFERDIIIHTFGIPAELLGITENSNRATIESADYLYSRWTLVPRLEFWRTELQEKLVPDFGNNFILEYDNPVPEDKEFQLNLIKASPYSFTINEVRNVAGLSPIPSGDKLPVTGTVSFIPISPGPVGEDLPYVEEENIQAEEARTTTDVEEKDLGLVSKMTPGEIDAMVDMLQPIILDTYTSPEIKRVVKDMGTRTLASVGVEPAFNMLSPLVVEHLQGYSGVDIKFITDTLRGDIKDRLTEGVLKGESVQLLSKRIKDLYIDYYENRSTVIARTEVMRSSNFARWQGLSQSGVVEGKRWLTARDSRVRFRGTSEGHRALHGKVVKINEPFRLRGASAQYPTTFGVPSLDIQCRCTLVPVVEMPAKSFKKESEEEAIILDEEWLEEAEDEVFTDEELKFAKDFDAFVEERIPVVRGEFNKAFKEQEKELLAALGRLS